MAQRQVKIQVNPQLTDETIFNISISVKNDLGIDDEIATFNDISPLLSVFSTLSQWSEQFTSTGGRFMWTFQSMTANAMFDFTDSQQQGGGVLGG